MVGGDPPHVANGAMPCLTRIPTHHRNPFHLRQVVQLVCLAEPSEGCGGCGRGGNGSWTGCARRFHGRHRMPHSSAGNTGLLFSGFCRKVLSYIAPTPLFAAVSATAAVEDLEPPADLPESCRVAWLLYAAAWAAAVAADYTAYVTCNACPFATPSCPPCLAAMASAAALHVGLVAAAANLEECLSQQSGSPGSGGGGGGGGSGDCYEVYWWISYDGGETRHLFEIEVVCPRGGPGET